jgi:hypothetical protein
MKTIVAMSPTCLLLTVLTALGVGGATGRRRLIRTHPTQRETSTTKKAPTNVCNFTQ